MEMRSHEFEVRLEEETRSVSGIAVPYGETIDLGGFQERVEQGAFDTEKQVPLFFGHDHKSIPIGKVVTLRDSEEGLIINATLNETSQGEDVYRALKSGDLSKFSIGFIPVKSRKEGDTIVREKAELKEVSVVSFPAYSGAGVSQVREEIKENKENTNMNEQFNDFSDEVAELRDSVTDLSRKFDKLEVPSHQIEVEYRSAGEWMKALAKGEQEARDFATSVDSDNIRPSWINDGLHILEKQRIVKGLFNQSGLPSTGNSIEYPYVKSQTGTVGVQATEGSDLSYLEIAIDTATASVVTYGGYSSMSRQVIERSDVAYLEAALRFQTIAYANATEAAVQSALMGTAATANEVEIDLTSTSPVVWLGAVLDAKAEIEDNSRLGLTADFILVSKDIHKKLALMVDGSGRPIFAANGDGSNTFASMPLNGRLAGVIDGTPVVVGRNLASGTVAVASREALVSRESAGAPFRLSDENIVNLTKDFSLYGYMAVAVPDAKGITFIVDDGA